MSRRLCSSLLAGWRRRATIANGVEARHIRCFTFSSDKDRVPPTEAFKTGKTTYMYHRNARNIERESNEEIRKLMGEPLQEPAGALWGPDVYEDGHEEDPDEQNNSFIPEVSLFSGDGRERKRILILCTGGTLTMAPDSKGSLAPVEGAISEYMRQMNELREAIMPDFVLHEYSPFRDSSDLGPADWVTLASDIKANYLQFDGFVVLTGTGERKWCSALIV